MTKISEDDVKYYVDARLKGDYPLKAVAKVNHLFKLSLHVSVMVLTEAWHMLLCTIMILDKIDGFARYVMCAIRS